MPAQSLRTTYGQLKGKERSCPKPDATPVEAFRIFYSSGSGPGGRRFKSSRPDHFFHTLTNREVGRLVLAQVTHRGNPHKHCAMWPCMSAGTLPKTSTGVNQGVPKALIRWRFIRENLTRSLAIA